MSFGSKTTSLIFIGIMAITMMPLMTQAYSHVAGEVMIRPHYIGVVGTHDGQSCNQNDSSLCEETKTHDLCILKNGSHGKLHYMDSNENGKHDHVESPNGQERTVCLES